MQARTGTRLGLRAIRSRTLRGRMAAVLAIPVAFAAAPRAADAQLNVTLYRTWTPPNATIVQGLFRVDGAMLGTGAECAYTVRLAVVDSAGTKLVNNEWEGRCPPPSNNVAAGALETFEFAVLPARYTVQLTVTPTGGQGAAISANVPLQSLATTTRASDLILARQAGWMDEAGATQWTIHKGQLGLAAASEVVADEKRPQIAYYLEVYPVESRPMSGTLVGVVRRPDGKQLARFNLQTLESVAVPKPLVGNVPLAGLAPGDYVFEARLELGDTVIARAHPFRMEGMLSQQLAVPAGGDTGYFFELTEAQLEELFNPVLVTLQRQAERELFQSLNPDGKRRFLQQYFSGAQPSPGGQAKNPLDLYLERVRYVNQQFEERRGGLAGWRTDRGRVHLLRGEPNNKVSRPLPAGGAPPFEIWAYTVPSNYVYLFVDESRIGSYRLVFSNDPNEASLPDWENRVSPDAAEELIRLGIPVRIRRN